MTNRPVIGRYEIVTRLATGGMAELLLAREHGIGGLERLVVIKKMLPHLAADGSFVDMFLREARIAARLQHPNIIEIFELGRDDEDYYIVMEYIEGSTARELQVLATKQGAFVNKSVAIAIVLQALKGLHAAHELKDLDGGDTGLVHRDISPHNIMCTQTGHVKLLDFGVAKATSGSEATYSGNLKGKFAYMSPEQCKRLELDRRTDLFSMGIVLWELCTGERLFKRESELEMMEAIVNGRIPHSSAIDAGLEQVFAKALAIERDQRYQTAKEFQQGLSHYARENRLDVSDDTISDFVQGVAGDQLALRSRTLSEALERSLTSREAKGLLHATGSGSKSFVGDTIEDKGDDDPGKSRETVISKHLSRDVAALTMDTETAADPSVVRSSSGDSSGSSLKTIVWFVIVLGVLTGVAAVLISRMGEDSGERAVLLGEPIPIAWAPTVDPEVLKQELTPFQTYLEQTISRPMPIEITKSYKESSEKLVSGDVAFALLPPLMYLRTKAQNKAIEPLGMKVHQGAKSSDALLLVRSDDDIKTLDELEGKTFCFTDENSTTGYFLPRAFLVSKEKNLETFIGKIVWTGDHIQSLRDLIDGKCDAAATYSGAMLSSFELDIPVARLRTLAVTGTIPQDVFVAGPKTDARDKQAVARALQTLDPQREWGTETLGSALQISGFAPVSDSDFEDLRALVEKNDGL